MATHSSSGLENPHGQRSLVGYSAWGRKDDWKINTTIAVISLPHTCPTSIVGQSQISWQKELISLISGVLPDRSPAIAEVNSWRREWQTLQYSCLENPMDSMGRQKDMTLGDDPPRPEGVHYATEEERRNSPRKNEEAGWANVETTPGCGCFWRWN